MAAFFSLRRLLLACAALGAITQAVAGDAPLKLDVYNPGSEALFPVSSVIVSGQHEAILVDAQFGKGQAEQVLKKLRDSGKQLTTIYISHGDPDYYFGLDTLTRAYPKAKVLASQATVAHIKQTMAAKFAYWGPQMGADKPARLIVPDVLPGNVLTLEGQRLEVIGLDGRLPYRSFVGVPSIKEVVGGVVVAENLHVWMADTQSAQSHKDWLATLARIEQLAPQTVVPGHYLVQSKGALEAVRFTADYIRAFDAETARAANSAELVAAMKKRYPGLGEESSLELGAKVAKGEMKW